MSARRALITGAGGFVGARLAERLIEAGVRTELVVRPGSESWRLSHLRAEAPVHELDLRNRDAVASLLARTRPDWILHLAAHGAYSWQSNAHTILETNLFGTLNLLEGGGVNGFAAFVHAGSSSEYGFQDHPPREDEAPIPNSIYAVAKTAATLLGQHLANEEGLNVTTLRLSSVYGAWEDPRRLIPTLIARGLGGELPTLVAPDTARDFVHVDDVCDAFLIVAGTDRPPSRIYNVGSGTQTTLREIVALARELLEIDAEPEWGTHGARRWDASVWVSDPRRIEGELGWIRRHDLRSGLAATIDWLKTERALWERYGVACA